MPDAYRSYVIRVRRHGGSGMNVRLELEDLIHGGQAAVDGEKARSIADGLEAILGVHARRSPSSAAGQSSASADPGSALAAPDLPTTRGKR